MELSFADFLKKRTTENQLKNAKRSNAMSNSLTALSEAELNLIEGGASLLVPDGPEFTPDPQPTNIWENGFDQTAF